MASYMNTDTLIKKKNLFEFQNPKSNSLFLFNNRFDEPTYLTFRIDFFPNEFLRNSVDDILGNYENDMTLTSYNDMPQPLLDLQNNYSTHKYLRDNIGDYYRADLLKSFIAGLADITWRTPYYIQEMDGINDLLIVDPKRGTRVAQDQVIILKCLDSLDQRITSLMNLYKKVAWDDVYQRWILPDMMRYFKMRIYISEFRVFHYSSAKSDKSEGIDYKSLSKTGQYATANTLNSLKNKLQSIVGSDIVSQEQPWSLRDSLIQEIMPTICLECNMCEFDITDIYSHLNSLSAADPKSYSGQPEIKIKVGNVTEILDFNFLNISQQSYKAKQLGRTISDKKLSVGKLNDTGWTWNEDELEWMGDANTIEMDSNEYNVDRLNRYDKTGIRQTEDLNPTTRYNIATDNKTRGFLGNVLENTMETAIGWVDNKANTFLNQAMETKILGGLSANDMINGLNSKNIFSMYNTFGVKSKAMQDLYPEVSAATKDGLSITAFKDMLKEHALSTATSYSDKELKEFSKQFLEYGEANNFTKTDQYIDTLREILQQINK